MKRQATLIVFLLWFQLRSAAKFISDLNYMPLARTIRGFIPPFVVTCFSYFNSGERAGGQWV